MPQTASLKLMCKSAILEEIIKSRGTGAISDRYRQFCMKKLFLIISIISSLNSFGQLPEFQTNVRDLDISQSLLNREFGSDYQIILGYPQKSFWFKRQEYSILTFDGSNWKLTKWSYELNKKEKPKKPKSTSFDINNQHVLDFLNFIN
jgi:hypothetical protein